MTFYYSQTGDQERSIIKALSGEQRADHTTLTPRFSQFDKIIQLLYKTNRKYQALPNKSYIYHINFY